MVLFYTSSSRSTRSTTVKAQRSTWSRWSWKPSRPLGTRHGLMGAKVRGVSLSVFFFNQICGASTPLETRPNPCRRNLGRLLSFTWRQPTHAAPNFPVRPGNTPPDHVRGLPCPTDPAPSSHTFLPASSR